MIKVNLQTLVNKANEMALHNIWNEKALKINMAIAKLDHNNCDAYTRMGKYYKLNDNISEATKMYLKVLEINPNNRIAINNINSIEKDQKETQAVDNIVSTNELLKEGKSSMVKGKYKLAVKLFSKAYLKDPLLANAFSLAGAYKKVEKYSNIEKLYDELINSNHKKSDVEAINNEFKLLRMK